MLLMLGRGTSGRRANGGRTPVWAEPGARAWLLRFHCTVWWVFFRKENEGLFSCCSPAGSGAARSLETRSRSTLLIKKVIKLFVLHFQTNMLAFRTKIRTRIDGSKVGGCFTGRPRVQHATQITD
jgi:hypothetical protein